MTREEFEAVLAVEGKYIRMVPTEPAGRWHKRCKNKQNSYWSAVVWNWQDVYPYHIELQRLVFGVPVEGNPPIQRVQHTIAAVRGASTNHKAIKHLMWAWEKGHF